MLTLVFVISFASNFITFELITPDIPNHATSATFSPIIEKGYLLQDYENRYLKGKNFEQHLINGIQNIKDSWNDGGPNC